MKNINNYINKKYININVNETKNWDGSEVDLSKESTESLKKELHMLCKLIKTSDPNRTFMSKSIIKSYKSVALDTIKELKKRNENYDDILSTNNITINDIENSSTQVKKHIVKLWDGNEIDLSLKSDNELKNEIENLKEQIKLFNKKQNLTSMNKSILDSYKELIDEIYKELENR